MSFKPVDNALHLIALIGCLILLIHSRLNFYNRQQRMFIVAALSGFLYLGLSVYGQFHLATLRASAIVNAYRIIKGLVAGMSAGLCLPIAWPKGQKTSLWICGLLFIALNIFIFTVPHFRNRRVFYGTNAVLAGMTITTAILHLQRRKLTEQVPT
jgi:peptidoglycan/LPS O-acetylase OafA/YrhL